MMLVFQPGATPGNEWTSGCLRKHTRASLYAKQRAAISLDESSSGCKEAVDAGGVLYLRGTCLSLDCSQSGAARPKGRDRPLPEPHQPTAAQSS
jgi:hypothetical protein